MSLQEWVQKLVSQKCRTNWLRFLALKEIVSSASEKLKHVKCNNRLESAIFRKGGSSKSGTTSSSKCTCPGGFAWQLVRGRIGKRQLEVHKHPLHASLWYLQELGIFRGGRNVVWCDEEDEDRSVPRSLMASRAEDVVAIVRTILALEVARDWEECFR